jgi:hypothetical protein
MPLVEPVTMAALPARAWVWVGAVPAVVLLINMGLAPPLRADARAQLVVRSPAGCVRVVAETRG